MSKRNYAVEIEALKARLHKRGSRFQHAWRRMQPLDVACRYLTETRNIPTPIKNELARYAPVACVSFLEGYFRLVYADLIDAGEPYRENAKNFDYKFSTDAILEVDSSLSAGELIAHLLPHNRVTDIENNMSTLLGKDFKQELRKVTLKASHETVSVAAEIDELWKALIETFSMRHIICHELATKTKYKVSDIVTSMWSTLMLQGATEAYFRDHLKSKE